MFSSLRPSPRCTMRVLHACRRVGRAYSTSSLKSDLRALFRDTAQPVAIVTSHMPHSSADTPFHGATLSSFSSISFDPHPLVAFSLRIPSRMATSLSHPPHERPARMVVNILSSAQEGLATRFSRVDLHPRPFEGVQYSLTEEGLPVLGGVLGALSCEVVGKSIPLHDMQYLKRKLLHGNPMETNAVPWEGEGVASELFIGRVTRVERVEKTERSDMPLIYHKRAYTSVEPTAPEKPRVPPSRPAMTSKP